MKKLKLDKLDKKSKSHSYEQLPPHVNPNSIESISHRVSHPYIITLKNTTDEKFYDVDVINYEHEKQDKIKYECNITGVTYNDFLRTLIGEYTPKIKIVRTLIVAHCDYKKFEGKQLNSIVGIRTQDSCGNAFDHPASFIIDPYQNQIDRVVSDYNYYLWSQLRLKMRFLMPETEVTFRLYPIKG